MYWFKKIALREWIFFMPRNFFIWTQISIMAVKMSIRIITKTHEADPKIGFLPKSISKPNGFATAMPTTWELKFVLWTRLKIRYNFVTPISEVKVFDRLETDLNWPRNRLSSIHGRRVEKTSVTYIVSQWFLKSDCLEKCTIEISDLKLRLCRFFNSILFEEVIRKLSQRNKIKGLDPR